jgi:hypothetical protein
VQTEQKQNDFKRINSFGLAVHRRVNSFPDQIVLDRRLDVVHECRLNLSPACRRLSRETDANIRCWQIV